MKTKTTGEVEQKGTNSLIVLGKEKCPHPAKTYWVPVSLYVSKTSFILECSPFYWTFLMTNKQNGKKIELEINTRSSSLIVPGPSDAC
jgi:hypothetical protein